MIHDSNENIDVTGEIKMTNTDVSNEIKLNFGK